MNRSNDDELFRCGLCQRVVDSDTRERARHAWQPLIICERCIREAAEPIEELNPAAAVA